MDEELVYHYTSIDVFWSMTKNMLEQKNSEKSFEFWASSCMCMNDYVELKHGYDVLMKLLKEQEKHVDERFYLSDICKDVNIGDKRDEEIPSFIKENSFNMDRLPYAISFSFPPEQVPLWTMYADNGRGVALGFKIDEIEGLEGVTSLPVIYNYDSINERYKTILKDIVKTGLSHYESKVKDLTDPQRIWIEKQSSLRALCTVLSPYFKHPCFKFENEYRLVKYCKREEVEYRNNPNGSIIPYVKINIPFRALKEVYIGPCLDCKITRSKIHTLMKYADPIHIVNIIPSYLPYRII